MVLGALLDSDWVSKMEMEIGMNDSTLNPGLRPQPVMLTILVSLRRANYPAVRVYIQMYNDFEVL
jgi:hypothetical protein